MPLAKAIPGAIPDAYPLDLPSGCILYYDFQETSSASGATIIDHSGCGNHGTNDGTLSQVGPNGRVRYFDGTDDNIEVNTVLPELFVATGLSIVVWTKITDVSPAHTLDQYFFHRDDSGGVWDGVHFGYGGVGGIGARLLIMKTKGGGNVSTVAAPDGDNIWRLYACTFSDAADEVVYYVDGAQLGAAVVNGGNLQDDNPPTFCKWGQLNTLRELGGQMGIAMVFSRTLSAHDIAELYRRDAWRYGLDA